MSSFDDVRRVLADTLRLGDRAQTFEASTPLLGSVPELDSMAVVAVITALEDSFGVEFDDDEISADTARTCEGLVDCVIRAQDEPTWQAERDEGDDF